MLKQAYRFLHPKFQNLLLDYKVDFKPRYGHGLAPHDNLYQIINSKREHYKSLLNETLQYQKFIHQIQDSVIEKNNTLPVWNNGFLPGLDIIMLYSMLMHYKPAKYVEIGSGNSTKVAYKAKSDHKLKFDIISIDPHPRAEIDHLTEQVIRKPFENIDLSLLDQLNENDILFVDNSHRILPNSDSMVFYLEILPRLKKGVIVHIHDIYLPYDYPQFMCDRGYSEQYGLAIYLLANPDKYQTLLPNYFISEDDELSKILMPVWDHANLRNVERHGGSFWLRINALSGS